MPSTAQNQLDMAIREDVVRQQQKIHDDTQHKDDEREQQHHADAEKVRARQRERDRYEKLDEHSESPIPPSERKVKPYVPQKTGAKAAVHAAGKGVVNYAKRKLLEDDARQEPQPTPTKPRPRAARRTTRAPPTTFSMGWGSQSRGGSILDGEMGFMKGFGNTTHSPTQKPPNLLHHDELNFFAQPPQGRKQPNNNFGLGFLQAKQVKRNGSFLDEMFSFMGNSPTKKRRR